jgi:hypothetical protein
MQVRALCTSMYVNAASGPCAARGIRPGLTVPSLGVMVKSKLRQLVCCDR